MSFLVKSDTFDILGGVIAASVADVYTTVGLRYYIHQGILCPMASCVVFVETVTAIVEPAPQTPKHMRL